MFADLEEGKMKRLVVFVLSIIFFLALSVRLTP
jgi:hypothetical protein